ncbi:MAG: integrase [Oxalobacter sp.]|nr:integrase [Oxalobacter sp.]
MTRMTPAQRHREKILAQQSEKKNASGNPEKGSAYEMMLVKLHADKRRLKDIQSIQTKATVKAEILPDYQPWVDGVLEGGQGAQDEVLMNVLVWQIDVGNYAEALRIAEYALEHDLVMPDQYTRTLATLLLDEITAVLLKEKYETAESIEYALTTLQKTEEITASRDAPDQARAKLYRAYGNVLLAKIGDQPLTPETVELAKKAEEYLEKALNLDERSGVKSTLNSLKKRLELQS